jgi:hypothetical protein
MVKITKCLTIGILYIFFTIAIAQTASPPPTKGLTKLSPQEFQQKVEKATLDNFKQSSDDYKRLYKLINPPPPSTHSTSTTTTSESQTGEISPPPPSKTDEDNEDNNEPDNNASTYYFQKKTSPTDSTTATPSGFNPYGTSKKE